MAANFLTTTSSMSCPHGGTVTAATSNTRVKADGTYILRATDTFTIAGCSFQISGAPHPCMTVRWDVHAMRHQSVRADSLTRDSVGICLAGDGATQGTVSISSTQERAKGT